jgi:general secretion pathway protein I
VTALAPRQRRRRSSRRERRGFTLLEVMVAMAILAIALSAVFAAEAGSVRMATRARKLGWASMLVRCKMGEIEEQIAKEGFPAIFDEGEDNCCAGAEIEGFTCKFEIEPVSMPEQMFEPEEEGEGEDGEDGADSKGSKTSKSADSKLDPSAVDGDSKRKTKLDPAELLKDPSKLLGGGSTPAGGGLGLGGLGLGGEEGAEGGGGEMDAIASMAMSYVYPILKPSFESQIRRATVTVMWTEGSAEKSFDVTQYLVAEQPIKLPDGTDPTQETDPNTGNPITPSNSKPGSSGQPSNMFPGSTNFKAFGAGNK